MSFSAPLPVSLHAYRLAMRALGPWLGLILRGRVRRGKEDPARLAERYGRPSAPRPDGPLAWLHGASVGESLMLLTVIDNLRAERPDLAIVMTTNTATSAELMAKRLPAGCAHQFVPFDHPTIVDRFLAHWRPDLTIFAESELWPNLILHSAAAGSRLALVNARMTETSLSRWARTPAAAHRLLSEFDWIGAADEQTATGLGALARQPVAVTGNLKHSAAPPPVDAEALPALSAAIGDRPVWLAASTHPGEEPIVLDAHRHLLRDAPARLLILVPRHPERGDAIAELARSAGFHVAQRSAADPISGETSVYVADTLGEMGLWFALGRVALMGGSLVPNIGGHNPLEPALVETPVIVGPHTHNFADLYRQLVLRGGARLVHNAEEIAAAVHALEEPAQHSAQRGAALAVAAEGNGVIERVMEGLRPLLPEGGHAGT